jgi:hypothetical protein
MDNRYKQLSYSSLLTLHSCPRQYELYKLSADRAGDTEEETGTFNFGSLVGDGIQAILKGEKLEAILFSTFLRWKLDLLYEDTKRKKSLAYAVFAIKKFAALHAAGFLKDYEVVIYKDKPACELSFRIHLPGGFKYRGFVDVVLQHKFTKEVIVLELKTTSVQVIANMYKNSSQAVGYSVVLDSIFPELSAYKVMYIVYKTKDEEFELLTYPKTFYQRALWLNHLLLDTKMIELYAENKVFPMHGENCINKFGKECKYFGICTMNTASLVKSAEDAVVQAAMQAEEDKQYEFEVQFSDLIHRQLATQITEESGENFTGRVDTEEDMVL